MLKKIGTMEWMRNKLIENDLNFKLVKEMYLTDFKNDIPDSTISEKNFNKELNRVYNKLIKQDQEVLSENVRLAKQYQKAVDLNRIKNKGFREFARIENSLEEYSKEIVSILKKHDLSKFTIKHDQVDKSNAGGCVQLSDLHFNELVDILGNKYDFNVAAQRLKLFANKIKLHFSSLNIKSILLCFTGDLLNSNRRLDELLNQSTNRADSTMLAFFLLKQFILDLNEKFNITIASVSGNESRIEQEHGFTDIIARDNFDFVLENLLKVQFMDCPGISFIDGGAKEKVISIAGQNILILHGEGLSGNNTQKVIQQKMAIYNTKGIIIHYIIYGHFHSANISDYSSRSSSMVGSNSYNEYSLNLAGRASQNIYIFYTNGNRDVIKIDLQNTEDIEGYDIINELVAYNAKSANKANSNHKTIMEIII
jgi:predicted phosphodiesterase